MSPDQMGVSYQSCCHWIVCRRSFNASNRPYALDERSLRRPAIHVAAFVRPYWRRIAHAMLGLVAAAAVLAIGEGLKQVIDQGFAAGSSAEIDKILVVMVALALAQGIGIPCGSPISPGSTIASSMTSGSASMPTC